MRYIPNKEIRTWKRKSRTELRGPLVEDRARRERRKRGGRTKPIILLQTPPTRSTNTPNSGRLEERDKIRNGRNPRTKRDIIDLDEEKEIG
jgi:hypothetical protein